MRPKGPRDPVTGPEGGPGTPFPIKLSGPVIRGFGRGSRELGIPTANIPPPGLTQYPDLESGVYYGFVGLRLHPDTTQPADNSKLTLSSGATGADATSAGGADVGQPMPDTGNDATALNTLDGNVVTNNNGQDDNPTSAEEQRQSAGQDKSTSIYPAVLSIGYNPYYKNKTRSIEIHILHHFPTYNFYHSPLNLLVLGFIRPEYDYESLEALVDDIKTDCDVARQSLERGAYKKWREDGWLKEFDWVRDIDVSKVEEEVTGVGVDADGEGRSDGKL